MAASSTSFPYRASRGAGTIQEAKESRAADRIGTLLRSAGGLHAWQIEELLDVLCVPPAQPGQAKSIHEFDLDFRKCSYALAVASDGSTYFASADMHPYMARRNAEFFFRAHLDVLGISLLIASLNSPKIAHLGESIEESFDAVRSVLIERPVALQGEFFLYFKAGSKDWPKISDDRNSRLMERPVELPGEVLRLVEAGSRYWPQVAERHQMARRLLALAAAIERAAPVSPAPSIAIEVSAPLSDRRPISRQRHHGGGLFLDLWKRIRSSD